MFRHTHHAPNGSDPDFQALRIIQQSGEEREEFLHVVLEAFDDVLENGVEDVDADFAVRGSRGRACLLEEREEGWPLASRNFDRCNGGDDARC